MNNEVNLKDIREVPILEEIKGTETVLINDDGAARQLPLEMVKSYVTPPPVEYDVDIEMIGRGNEEIGSVEVITCTVHKVRPFAELKQMIMDETIIKGKMRLRCAPMSDYPDSFICENVEPLYCAWLNKDLVAMDTEEEIGEVIVIRGYGTMLGGTYAINENNEVINTYIESFY